MCFVSSGPGRIAKEQRAEEVARQQRIQSGMAAINNVFDNPASGFNEDFYKRREQGYTDYAMPEVNHEYDAAKKNLVFALSRSGILTSSAGIDKNAELSREFDRTRTDVASKALDYGNQARGQVEQARGNIVAQLNATGDDQGAASAALRQTQQLQMPIGYSPLAGLFANFTSGVSGIGSNARSDYGGFAGGGKPSLFKSTSGGSARVVGG
jgi:hypothetical protein